MVVFVQSVLLTLLFVTSFEYNLAATTEQGRGVWKPDEKMNLMKIWNRIYRGKRTNNYRKTLYQEWLKIYPDGRGKTINSLPSMVDRLLRDTFVIPPEDSSQNAIRLSMDVRQKRDSGFSDYVEILPPNYKRSSKRYNQHIHFQLDPASTSGHQQTNQDLADSETDRRVGSKEEKASPPWEPIDDINLMKAIVNTMKYWKNGNYKQKLFKEFERSDPEPARRTLKSVVNRAKELRTEGFVIPAKHNNGEEVKVESEPRLSYTYWKPEEEIILMKALHEVQDYKGSSNYGEKLLEVWDRLHSKPSKRNIDSLLLKARVLNRRGFVIPAKYNNGEEIRIEPDETQHGTLWNPREKINLRKAYHAAQKYRGTNHYQKKLLEEWNSLNSTPLGRTPKAVLSKARDLNRKGVVIPAEYNDGKGIIIEPEQVQQQTRWHPMEEILLRESYHAAQKYRGSGNYQQKLLEEWDKLHSTPSEKRPESVLRKARNFNRREFVIPAEYNDGDQSRSETIICEPKGKKKCQEPEIIDEPRNSKSGGRRKGYLNQLNNRSSDMDDQSEPGSSRTYDVYPSQSSSQTSIRNPYADVVMEDNVHQPLYYPQSAHFYHGSNDPSYGGSVTPRPRRGSHYSVYQSDIAQHHHGSSSTTHHQSQHQPDPRDESQPSTSHSIP